MQILQHATSQTIANKAFGTKQFTNADDALELAKVTAKQLDKLDANGQLAVEAAYVFSRKAPVAEREDLFQELVLAVLDSGTDNPAWAYTIARRDWQDFWRKYNTRDHFYGGYLSDTITNSDGEETELAELLVGEVEFERKQLDKLDAQSKWAQIPADIQKLVLKRLQGKPLGAPRQRKGGRPKLTNRLDNTERSRLNRWVKSEGFKLLIS